jgi:hypothetical protein
MTKQDAIKQMRDGKKLTHTHFMDSEWITMKGNLIITEDGHDISLAEFFLYRSNEGWETGWEIYKPSKVCPSNPT